MLRQENCNFKAFLTIVCVQGRNGQLNTVQNKKLEGQSSSATVEHFLAGPELDLQNSRNLKSVISPIPSAASLTPVVSCVQSVASPKFTTYKACLWVGPCGPDRGRVMGFHVAVFFRDPHCTKGPVFNPFSLCSLLAPLSAYLVTICSALSFLECHRIETWHVWCSAWLLSLCQCMQGVFSQPDQYFLSKYCSSWELSCGLSLRILRSHGFWRLSHPDLPRCLCFCVLH